MKSNVEVLAGVKRKLNIEVPALTVQKTFNKVLENIQKSVALKGFRKGKAPLSTLRSIYSANIKQDVVNDLIRDHYIQAISTHELYPIGDPEFEFSDPAEDQDFVFAAHIELRPQVKVKSYKDLEIPKEKLVINEAKITVTLENIRKSQSTTQDVLELRPAQLGDIAIVDFEGFVDGKPLENGAGKDHSLELGSQSFIAGFEEGIVGMSLGGTTTLHLAFPNPYHAPELAGKPVDFKVTLKSLKKKVLPELTDEFAKSLGGPADLEELKKNIRAEIESTEKQRIEEDFKNQILKKLIALNPVDVPSSLLKEQKKALVEDVKRRMSEQGMSKDELPEYLTKWDKDLEGTASEMIQSSFIIDAIATEKNLHCTDEDVEAMIVDYAAKSGIEIEKIRNFYSRADQDGRLRYSITEKKVIDEITSSIKIKEVQKAP
jgi:trigger factor